MLDTGDDDYYSKEPFSFNPRDLSRLRKSATSVHDLGPSFYSSYYIKQFQRDLKQPEIDRNEVKMITEASQKSEYGFNQLFNMIKHERNENEGRENEEDEDIFKLSPQCKEYSLFQYFEKAFKTGMVLPFKDIKETCYYKLIELVDELNEASITEMIRTFINTLLLQLISQDKKGVKVLEIMNKFHELYITSTKNNMGKNDYTRFDYLNQLIDATFKQACDIKSDPIYLNYSQTKQRGRRREEDKLEDPNEVDSIRCNSISAAQASDNNTTNDRDTAVSSSVAANVLNIVDGLNQKKRVTKSNKERKKRELIYHPPNDEYKVLLNTMKIIYDNLPRETNHGGYQKELRQWIRDYEVVALGKTTATPPTTTTTPQTNTSPPPVQWPLWRLLRAICNMQYMTDIRLRKNFQTKGKLFYCDYSGDLIQDGEDIYIIEIYENDIVRFIKWDINKTRPNREFESEELLKSNRMFFLKKTRCSPVSLFPKSFSSEYKSHYPSYFYSKEERRSTEKKEEEIIYNPNYTLTLINHNHFKTLLQIKENRYTSSDIGKIQCLFDDINIETFNSDLIKVVSQLGYASDKEVLKQVIKVTMDFVDLLIDQNDCGMDVIKDVHIFTSMVTNSIFKGRDTTGAIELPQNGGQVRIKNSIVLRGFLYITYKRRLASLMKNTDIQEIRKFNYFYTCSTTTTSLPKGTPINEIKEFRFSEALLIALFDYLFRIVY